MHRIPPEIPSDGGREPCLSIERAKELADVHDRGLQLDDQEGPRRGMPRQEVDDTALAADRERDLRTDGPATDLREAPDDRLGEGRVMRMDEPIEIAATPPRRQVDADLEGRGHGADGVHGQQVEAPALQTRDRRVGDAGPIRDVALPQPATKPDRPEPRTELDVVHAAQSGPPRFAGGYCDALTAAPCQMPAGSLDGRARVDAEPPVTAAPCQVPAGSSVTPGPPPTQASFSFRHVVSVRNGRGPRTGLGAGASVPTRAQPCPSQLVRRRPATSLRRGSRPIDTGCRNDEVAPGPPRDKTTEHLYDMILFTATASSPGHRWTSPPRAVENRPADGGRISPMRGSGPSDRGWPRSTHATTCSGRYPTTTTTSCGLGLDWHHLEAYRGPVARSSPPSLIRSPRDQPRPSAKAPRGHRPDPRPTTRSDAGDSSRSYRTGTA